MSELIEAAKAVIDAADTGDRWCAIANLKSAVEQAESDDEIDRENEEAMNIYLSGVMAERERFKEIIGELLDPEDPWIHYSTLLEKIDDL